MTSQISLNKLMREDLRHKKTLVTLSVFFNLMLGPVLMMFELSTNRVFRYANVDSKLETYRMVNSFITEYYSLATYVIAFVGAIICGIAGFKYLYSKKYSDMMHSIPVTRRRLFVTSYLNGVLIWIIPTLVSFVLTFFISFTKVSGGEYRLELFSNMLGMLPKAILVFFMVYHVSLLGAFLSGTVGSALASMLIIGCNISLAHLLILAMLETLRTTFINAGKAFTYTMTLSPLFAAGGVMTNSIWSNDNPGTAFYVLNIIILLANLVLALRVFEKRPSENAQQGVINKIFICIGKVGSVFCAGSFCGYVLCALMGSFGENDGVITVWSVFAIVVGSLIMSVILGVLFKNSVKGYKENRLTVLFTTIVAILVFIAIRMDWMGYDSYIIDKDNIRSASVVFTDLCDGGKNIHEREDGTLVFEPFTILTREDRLEFSDVDAIYALLENGVNNVIENDNMRYVPGALTMEIKVNRKFGGSYYRRYFIDEEAKDAIAKIVETPQYTNEAYALHCGNIKTPHLIVIENTNMGTIGISGDDCEKFIAAYAKDFYEHRSLDDLISYDYIYSFEYNYFKDEMNNADEIALNYYSSYANSAFGQIPTNYTNTLEFLNSYMPEANLVNEIKISDVINEISASCSDFYTNWVGDATDKDVIYSYFGMPGYTETMNDSYDQNYNWGTIQVPNDIDWNSLSDVLETGFHVNFFEKSNRYIYLGYVNHGKTGIDISVPAGAMPTDILDKMTLSRDMY